MHALVVLGARRLGYSPLLATQHDGTGGTKQHVYIYIYICVWVRVCVCACVCPYLSLCVCVCIHIPTTSVTASADLTLQNAILSDIGHR